MAYKTGRNVEPHAAARRLAVGPGLPALDVPLQVRGQGQGHLLHLQVGHQAVVKVGESVFVVKSCLQLSHIMTGTFLEK